ncbi:mercury resistance system transport protein MerF [Nitrosomonas sp.]|uniref:mercury resistance system transport protein MerF n=1 Tax=Nitrosomonas sp. TaxID=42353 RepID=UPI0020875216|nr:mercury resistance system transport protein MerF [Nitrosomonas sp.]GJL75973.1 MAG: membrane protein [Nitrosomonas sp.]
MADRSLLRTGIVGTLIEALCCFTPVLVWLLAVVGLSALTGYLDIVLFPALAFFIALTVYAVWSKQHSEQTTNEEGDR